MNRLTSKLQYQITEDGEYHDEKKRTLEETLKLINTFDWQRQQFAEVDLTGPSVIIKNIDNSYLKIGLHYGGAFHLYYLDSNNNFYERYPISLDSVRDIVTTFFSGNFTAELFVKQRFTYQQRQYFETRKFDYYVNPWKSLLYTFWLWITAIALGVGLLVSDKDQNGARILFIVMVTGLLAAPLFCLIKAMKYKGQRLQISRGKSTFIFGSTKGKFTTYNKADVVKIITTTSVSSKSPIGIELITIEFKNGASIRFPNLLISAMELAKKFPKYYRPEFITQKKWILLEL